LLLVQVQDENDLSSPYLGEFPVQKSWLFVWEGQWSSGPTRTMISFYREEMEEQYAKCWQVNLYFNNLR
jgi:hypothetical protein